MEYLLNWSDLLTCTLPYGGDQFYKPIWITPSCNVIGDYRQKNEWYPTAIVYELYRLTILFRFSGTTVEVGVSIFSNSQRSGYACRIKEVGEDKLNLDDKPTAVQSLGICNCSRKYRQFTGDLAILWCNNCHGTGNGFKFTFETNGVKIQVNPPKPQLNHPRDVFFQFKESEKKERE